MDDTVRIFDTTLRDGEQSPGVSLNTEEKLEIARQLERLGVDVIEAGFPIASKGDFEAVSAIAREVRKPSICGLCRAVKGDIDRACEALKGAARPRIHVFIATSDIHLKYKLKMTREEVLKAAVDSVAYAKSLGAEVQFSAEDASRTDPGYLYKVFGAVIEAGADVINVPDTVGYSVPDEFAALIKGIKENVPGIDKVQISVHCHNDLGMATANSLAAVQNGIQQVEGTINGIGERAGNAALEEIIMALNTRRDYFKRTVNIDTTQIYRTSMLVAHLTGMDIQPNKAIVGANAFAHEAGIHQHGVLSERSTYEIMTPESIGLKQNKMVLGKLSGRHAFEERLKELGYNLTQDEINEAFERFKDLADKKKVVLDKDIEALVSEKAIKIHEIYTLDQFQISSGNKITATATVRLKHGDEYIEEAACGDGPVEAVFNAIERCIGREVPLDNYSIRAVTEGKDALGEVTVRVINDGQVFVGKGVSTDIIEASARAYIDAINKMLYESSD